MRAPAVRNDTGRIGAGDTTLRLTRLNTTERRHKVLRLLRRLVGAAVAALAIGATWPYLLPTLAYALSIAACGGLVLVAASVGIAVLRRCIGIARMGLSWGLGRPPQRGPGRAALVAGMPAGLAPGSGGRGEVVVIGRMRPVLYRLDLYTRTGFAPDEHAVWCDECGRVYKAAADAAVPRCPVDAAPLRPVSPGRLSGR